MRLKEDIKTVTCRQNQATESYEALRDATMLLQLVAQGEADLQEGRVLSQDEAFARARTRLRGR
jgi:hypothetical protein